MNAYLIDRCYLASQGIAYAILVTLGMGLLLQTIGKIISFELLMRIGESAKLMLIPALGIGISMQLKAHPLVTISAAIVALIGGNALQPMNNALILTTGEPIGAILTVIIAVWTAKRLKLSGSFALLLIPGLTLLIGGISGLFFARIMPSLLDFCSSLISASLTESPIISSMIIGVIFGLCILSPASSAALAMSLQLEPSANAAILIGCSVQFVSFASLSWRDNNYGALLAQLICTPKLQTANLIKKPTLMIIPMLLTCICSPLGVVYFNLQASADIAGLGLCALIAPLYLFTEYGINTVIIFLTVVIILPSIIILLLSPWLYQIKHLQKNDLTICLD